MKTDYATSASSSAATSASKPTPPNDPDTDQKHAGLSESEYLAQQAHNAQLAMSRAWQELKVKLGQGADPTAWAQEHPWIAVGAAAAAGFVATAALVPSKEEQTLKKLAAIERALNPDQAKSNGNGSHEKGGMLGTILGEVVGLLKPVIASVLAANLGGGAPAAVGSAADTASTPPDQQRGRDI